MQVIEVGDTWIPAAGEQVFGNSSDFLCAPGSGTSSIVLILHPNILTNLESLVD